RRTVAVRGQEASLLLRGCGLDIQQPQPFTKILMFRQCRKHASVPQSAFALRCLERPDIGSSRTDCTQPLLKRPATKCASLGGRLFKRIIDAVISQEPNLFPLATDTRGNIKAGTLREAQGFHNVDTDDGIEPIEGYGVTNRTPFNPRVIRGYFRVDVAIQYQRGLRRSARVFRQQGDSTGNQLPRGAEVEKFATWKDVEIQGDVSQDRKPLREERAIES